MDFQKERLDQDFIGEQNLLEILGVTKSTLDRLIREKEFPYIRLGIKKIYSEASIIAWLKRNELPKSKEVEESDRVL